MCPVPEATTLRSAQHSCWGTEDVTPSHPCPGQLHHMDRTPHQERWTLQGLMPNIWSTVRTRGDDAKEGAGATPADRYTTPEISAPQLLRDQAQSKPTQQHTLLRDQAEEVSLTPLWDRRGSHHSSLQRPAGDKQQVVNKCWLTSSMYVLQTLYGYCLQ